MGLLDAFAGQVLQSLGTPQQQPQGAPEAPSVDVVHSVMNMLASPQSGGLSGLVNNFEQAGLGSLVNSWVGTGQNIPATPQQIQKAVPPNMIQDLTSKLGISTQQLLPILAMLLPVIVDKLTPKGQLPSQPAQAQGLDGLLGGVLGMLNR